MLKTYNLEASKLTKSRSGRESMQFINNYIKACSQPGVVMKCLGMLLEDMTGSSGRVTVLDRGGKWIDCKIFLCQLSIFD